MPRNVNIQLRRGTAAEWAAANPVLEAGEPGYETDTGVLKIGDGVTAYNSLDYVGTESFSGSEIDTLLTTVNSSNISATHKITRSATIVVAASNSSAQSKAQADYVCDGTNDEEEIQAAIDALPATGGEIRLLDGLYTLGATVSRAIDNVTITGSGKNTFLQNNGTVYIFSLGSQSGWIIQNLSTDSGGIGVQNAERWIIKNWAYRYTYATNFVTIPEWSSEYLAEPLPYNRANITYKHKLVAHIDNFESGWTAASGTVTSDTDIVFSGAASTKVVTVAGVASELEKAITLDVTDAAMGFWMYTPDHTKLYRIHTKVKIGAEWTTLIQDEHNFIALPTVSGKWTQFVVPYFKKWGTPDLANATAVKLVITPVAGEVAEVYLNDLTIWKNKTIFPNGVVTFVFDDGISSVYELAKPKMDQYGYAGNWALIKGRLTSTTVSQAMEMQNDGWDIMGHSVDHISARMLTDPKFQYAIPQKWLAKSGFGGSPYVSLAYGAHNKDLADFIDLHLMFCTTALAGMNSPPNVPPLLRTRPMEANTSVETIHTWIDTVKLQGCWSVLVLHDIVAANPTGVQVLQANFEDVIDYCHSVGVEVLPYSQVVERMKSATQMITLSGSGTIANGSTSVNIRHGFNTAPTSIQITPTSSLGTAASIWVSSKDTGTGNLFTVSCNTNPGQDITFDWQAVI